MAEITADTGSYPKPQAGKSLLDQVQQYGAIEQQALNIDRGKLELAIKNQDQLLQTLNALPKDATPEDMRKWGQSAVKMKLVNPKLYAEFVTNMPAPTGDPAKDAEALARYRQTVEQKAMTTSEVMQWKYGQQFDRQTAQSTTPMVRDPRSKVETPVGAPIAAQLPPSTPRFNPATGQMEPIGQTGDQIPPGAQPARGGAPGAYVEPSAAPMQPRAVPTQSFKRPGLSGAVELPPEGPINDPRIKGESANFGGNVLGATVENAPVSFNDRFGSKGPIASTPPAMFEEGKKSLVADQQEASQRAMRIKPLAQAIDLMQKPGMLSGPLSDQFTQGVAALKTFGLISQEAGDPTAIRQEVAKKLAQYVSGNPVGQRSDNAQVLAEASSPNPKAQTIEALFKLSKDAIALDRIQIAMPNVFKDKDLSKYGSHKALFPQSIDERAFSLDFEKDRGQNLVNEMAKKAQSKNAKEKREAEKFFKSLEIADQNGFY